MQFGETATLVLRERKPHNMDIFSKNLGKGISSGVLLMGLLFPSITIPFAHTYDLPQPVKTEDIETQEASKEPSALDAWIERLIRLESNGKNDIKVLDANGWYSYGCLQFQKPTFVAYGTRYDLFEATDDINALIYDCDLQKELAGHLSLIHI